MQHVQGPSEFNIILLDVSVFPAKTIFPAELFDGSSCLIPESIPKLFRICRSCRYAAPWPCQWKMSGLSVKRLGTLCPKPSDYSWDHLCSRTTTFPANVSIRWVLKGLDIETSPNNYDIPLWPVVRFGAFCIRQRLGFYQWKDVDWRCPTLDMKHFLFVFSHLLGQNCGTFP